MTFPNPDVDQVPAQLPHSREAEEAVLGSVMIAPEIFHECRLHIKNPREYYIHRHRMIWAAYEKLINEKIPVDLLTVTDQLEKQGDLESIGGGSYLMSLMNQVPTSLNAPAYAAIVHDHHIRREIITSANKQATLAYDLGVSIDEALANSVKGISDVAALNVSPRVHSMSEAVQIVDDKIEQRKTSGVKPGIPTGLIDLDKLMGGGAQNSDLLLICARPGQGKTSLLLQLCRMASRFKLGQQVFTKRVVFFSLEMPEEQLVLRMISQISGIDYQTLRAGETPDEKLGDYLNAIDELSNLDIVIDDTPSVSPSYIKSRCEILNSEKKLHAIFVDSLNLMKSGLNIQRTDQEVDHNATGLKNIAREFDVPVWACHQMNREIERRGDDARPKLADLAEGGERPTDFVMFIHNKYDQIKKKVESSELIIEKHRNGKIGNVPVVFLPENTKFESAYRQR